MVSENRKEGLKKISKYLYLLLMAIRKLPKYYPNDKNKYLYRCINVKVKIFIDHYNPKFIPYIRGNTKTFWTFTSTSPNPKTSIKFLGKNGSFENRKLKYGTIFSLYGNVWGYDITLFNFYNEEEILLEPERKIFIENVFPDVNDIISVTCEVKDTPIILAHLIKEKNELNN